MSTFSGLLLVDTISIVLFILLPIVGLAVGAVAVWLILKNVSKKKSEKKLDDTSRRVEEMLESAKAECKQIKKEAILEAKEQELKRRNEFEQEMKEKRAEQAHIESRLNRQQDALERKETELNRKNESLEAQKNNLTQKMEEVQKTQEQVERQHDLMIAELERIAQLSKDEAKKLRSEERRVGKECRL